MLIYKTVHISNKNEIRELENLLAELDYTVVEPNFDGGLEASVMLPAPEGTVNPSRYPMVLDRDARTHCWVGHPGALVAEIQINNSAELQHVGLSYMAFEAAHRNKKPPSNS